MGTVEEGSSAIETLLSTEDVLSTVGTIIIPTDEETEIELHVATLWADVSEQTLAEEVDDSTCEIMKGLI